MEILTGDWYQPFASGLAGGSPGGRSPPFLEP